MDTKKKLYRDYHERKEQFKQLELVAKSQLDRAIKSQRIKTHSMLSRVKSFDSFAKKTRRKSLQDPFNEVCDLVGLRVICLFLSDLSKVATIIKNTFKLISEEDKIDQRPKNVFGYMDIQYIVALKDLTVAGIEPISFEIQIRTIAQDAWACVSHELYYKQPETIPKEWERDFYALSALFYVADQHFRILHQQSSSRPLMQ